MPSKHNAWVSTLNGLILHASPKSKVMLEKQGLIVSPKTSEKKEMHIYCCKKNNKFKDNNSEHRELEEIRVGRGQRQ